MPRSRPLPNRRFELTGAATAFRFVRQGAVDEAVNRAVRQGPSRPQLKRGTLASAQ